MKLFTNLILIFLFALVLIPCEETTEDENGNICLVIGTCNNCENCKNCSYVENVNNCINVTYAKNVSDSENVTKAENCSKLINVTEAYNVDDCQNSDFISDSQTVYDSQNVINCTNCQSCINVSHAIKVSDVANSEYIVNVSSSSDCKEVYNTSNCYDCYNVTNSRFCTKCHRCYQCEDCSRCIGYKCKGMEDCRYTKWARDWIEPASTNTKAWSCSNPLFIEEMFKKDGYEMPKFLEKAEISTGFSMCHGFESNKSCCNADTTKKLKQIYDHYKETLELRAGMRVKQLKEIFEVYKNLNYTDVPNSVEMRNGVIERMRDVKIMIYKMSLSMGTCGQKMLEWLSAMLCMGCLPDWRWQKYVQINNSYVTDEEFFDFDPDIEWTEDYATIDLENIYAKEIQISKQMCDSTFEECKEVTQHSLIFNQIIEKYRLFRNETAMAIGNLTEGLTSNQEWTSTQNAKESKEIITQYIAEITGTDLEYLHRDDDSTRPSTSKSPSSQPVVSKDEQKVQDFKTSLYNVGDEYPFDPVVYLSFHPQINFESPIYMDDDMCEAMALTEVGFCSFCVYHNDTEWDESEAWEPSDEECIAESNSIYLEIDEETNRQYREFSAYFSQVRAVIATYTNEKDSTDIFTRHLLFPPFREAEIYLIVSNMTFTERKKYYQELEGNITEQYTLFKAEKEKQDDFTIWNDEYWMFFVYGAALNQGKSIYKTLISKWIDEGHTILDAHIFTCDYDNTCKLCNSNNENECFTDSPIAYTSYCEDCHYSKVKLQATCRDNSCISCIYIGGDESDIDEDDGTQNDPMEKCWIRAYRPYFDEVDSPDSQYFPTFHRDRADPDEYYEMEEIFDFANRKNVRYNVATISEWYYLRSPQDEIMRFSIQNVRYMFNTTGSLKPPNMTNGTRYPYNEYCQITHPVNDCKDRLCDKMLTSFFPKYKVSYDPQDSNDTEIESTYAISDIFNKEWIESTTASTDSWQMAFGAYSQDDNDTYYDAKYYGPLMIYENETIITIEGINQFSDLESAAENEEQFVFAVMKSMLSVLTLIFFFII